MAIPLSYSIRSLFVRKATTFASAFGIALVVFVLAASLMLSHGIERTLGASGKIDRALVLRKGADAELASSIEQPKIGLILAAPGVKQSEGKAVGAGEVVIVISADKLGTNGQVSNIQVRGVQPVSYDLRKELRIVDGRRAEPGTDEAVIGRNVRGRFRGLELGQTFELKKNRPVKVVGVFEADGSSFESEVWVDADTLRSSFGRSGIASSVLVQLESQSSFDAFKSTIEHDKQLGLQAFRETEYYEKASEGTSMFIRVMGILVTFFFSLGAMIGATITMYAAVSQRAKEIGTLKALGFSKLSILSAFVTESVILAVIGGAFGALVSLAMGLVKFSMMNFATWQEITFSFTPTPGIVIGSVVTGSIMGFFGGLLPAIRAARMSALEAMRS